MNTYRYSQPPLLVVDEHAPTHQWLTLLLSLAILTAIIWGILLVIKPRGVLNKDASGNVIPGSVNIWLALMWAFIIALIIMVIFFVLAALYLMYFVSKL